MRKLGLPRFGGRKKGPENGNPHGGVVVSTNKTPVRGGRRPACEGKALGLYPGAWASDLRGGEGGRNSGSRHTVCDGVRMGSAPVPP